MNCKAKPESMDRGASCGYNRRRCADCWHRKPIFATLAKQDAAHLLRHRQRLAETNGSRPHVSACDGGSWTLAGAVDAREQYNIPMVGMGTPGIGREWLIENAVEFPMMQSTTIMNEARPND